MESGAPQESSRESRTRDEVSGVGRQVRVSRRFGTEEETSPPKGGEVIKSQRSLSGKNPELKVKG